MLPQEVSKRLVEIWGTHTKKGDFVFLSKKDPQSGRWTDRPFLVTKGLQDEVTKWIQHNPPSEYHLYFCPLPFKSSKRRKDQVKGSQMLWSDLDEVDVEKLAITPSLYWESSPGRYQGLWLLDDFVSPKEAELLSKKLAYTLGADKSGWDLTQVLRIPGTKNHKYHGSPDVGDVVKTGEVYSLEDMPETEKEPEEIPLAGNLDARDILAKYRTKIPRKALSLLLTKNVTVGKRSDILWYLEQTLLDAGLSLPEILTLVKNSAWNKYKGRADEEERLRVELTKILEGRIPDADEEAPQQGKDFTDTRLGLRVDSYSNLMGSITSEPGWLVEGFWTKESHGIVAGEPKAFKSILTLDMAISVASGEPFLGKFEVHQTGPVLIIQNENSDWIMKDRVQKMITHKDLTGEMKIEKRQLSGYFPPELPIHFINQQGFQFNDPIHKEVVEQLVKDIEPVLVIFDPLYLMFDGDLNTARDLNPALSWLLELKQRYGTAITLVHHWNKGGQSPRGGQRMLGSTTLHGWVESAWYVKVPGGNKRSEDDIEDEDVFVDKPSGEPVAIIMEREFRGAGTYPKVEATLRLGAPGDTLYRVDIKKHAGRGNKVATNDVEAFVLNLLEMTTKPLTQRYLSEEAGVGRKALKKIMEKLVEQGKVTVDNKGATLVR